MAGSVAATIQGEAGSNPANQFAVASTIYNRLQAGGYGNTAFDVVNRPQQFVGTATPNATAQNFANAIENGTLPNYGNTGNAVNFQSGPTAARNGFTQGGANIGGNYFSDRFGAPTSNFSAPQYQGAGTQVADGAPDSSSGIPAGPGSYTNPENLPRITVTPNPGTATQSGPGPGGTPNVEDAGKANDPMTPDTGAAGGAGGAAGGGGGGMPINLMTLGPGTTQPITGWISNIEKAFGGGLDKALKAGGTATANWLGGLGNWFFRGLLIFLGILLIAVGLIVLMWDHGGKEVTEKTVKAVAAA
jgi:hypothetical protein